MPSSPLVLAVGAAGPYAGLVVPALIARGARVRGLLHKPEDEAQARKNGCTEIALGELADTPAVTAALHGVDAAFYISPVAMPDESATGIRFIQAAKNAGVRRVVFSSVIRPGLSLENHASKLPIEEALRSSGLEYTILQPAIFFQTMTSGWQQAQTSGTYAEPWSTHTRFSRVDYRDVAEVAAIALTQDHLLYGTFELAAEGWLNRTDVAHTMSTVLGHPIRAEQAPLPPPGKLPDQLLRMMQWYDTHELLANPLTLHALLPHPPRTLQTFLTETRTPT